MRFALLCLCVFIQAAYAHQQNNGMLRRNNFVERSRKKKRLGNERISHCDENVVFFRTFCCFCIWLMQRIIISAVCFRIQALCLGVFACCIRVYVVCFCYAFIDIYLVSSFFLGAKISPCISLSKEKYATVALFKKKSHFKYLLRILPNDSQKKNVSVHAIKQESRILRATQKSRSRNFTRSTKKIYILKRQTLFKIFFSYFFLRISSRALFIQPLTSVLSLPSNPRNLNYQPTNSKAIMIHRIFLSKETTNQN